MTTLVIAGAMAAAVVVCLFLAYRSWSRRRTSDRPAAFLLAAVFIGFMLLTPISPPGGWAAAYVAAFALLAAGVCRANAVWQRDDRPRRHTLGWNTAAYIVACLSLAGVPDPAGSLLLFPAIVAGLGLLVFAWRRASRDDATTLAVDAHGPPQPQRPSARLPASALWLIFWYFWAAFFVTIAAAAYEVANRYPAVDSDLAMTDVPGLGPFPTFVLPMLAVMAVAAAHIGWNVLHRGRAHPTSQ